MGYDPTDPHPVAAPAEPAPWETPPLPHERLAEAKHLLERIEDMAARAREGLVEAAIEEQALGRLRLARALLADVVDAVRELSDAEDKEVIIRR